MTAAWGRAALLLLGLLVALVGLELLLRAGSLWVGGEGSGRVAAPARGDAHRILCVGDSNTYGVYLADREQESYPAQLEGQLLHLLVQRGRFEKDFEPGGSPGREQRLTENLRRIVATARARDVDLVLMTYPGRTGFYPQASHWIRQVAQETRTRLVDQATVFAQLCPDEACTEWLYEDGHPRASGYEVMAKVLLAGLAGPLPASGPPPS